MPVQGMEMLSTVARELHISEEELLRQGLRRVLEHQLRAVKAEIFEISSRYGVSSVAEMETRYRDGTLEEADSWRDLQRLDHLEYACERAVTTFPCHFHNGSETNVSESYLSAVPEEALREFLTFVRTTLGAAARGAP